MAHRVHGVMRFVTMKCPVTRLGRIKFNRAHLADADVNGDLGPARGRWCPATIRTRHRELMSMQVNRMISHRQITDPYAYPVVLTHPHRINTGENATIKAPEIKVQHGIDLGGCATGRDVEAIEQENKITIDTHEIRVFRVGHPKTHHAHRHLHHFIRMRVIHEGPRALCFEFIHKGFTHRYAWLRQSSHTIHAIGQPLPVPVHAGCLRQAISHENTHTITFHHFNRRPRRLTVVTPQVGFHAGGKFPHHGLGHQVEFFHALFHSPGQRPAIERDHRIKRSSVFRQRRWCGPCVFHHGGFRQ